MIPLQDLGWQGQPWQWQIAHAVRDANELTRLLHLEASPISTDFPLLVPWPYLARIEPGDRNDPLLRQILPIAEEGMSAPGFGTDPVADLDSIRQNGVLQKYDGRLLVITSGACAINCRYCFRRHFPYESFQPSQRDWDAIVDTTRSDPSIREVILSGGDPLVLSDRQLGNIAGRLEAIETVDTLRIHTRLPIVIPSRICESLLAWVRKTSLRVVVVVHVNHPNEIDNDVVVALEQLAAAGVTLLNQSVLLAGVNDDAAVLTALGRRLFDARTLPYYLHQLDPVAGAAHFQVGDKRALELMHEVRSELPGYLVPRLVREVASATSKVPVG